MPRHHGRLRADEGLTLIELVVAMAIASIVGAIITTSMMMVYRTVNATSARAAVQAQLSQALMRLDREIRYASYVGSTVPGQKNVEYEMVNKMVTQCVQLRLAPSASGSQLQRRTWTQGAAAADLTAWLPLATGVTSVSPFTRIDPVNALTHQQLMIDLTAVDGVTQKHANITYTALNTNTTSVSVATAGTGLASAEPCYNSTTRT
jgi:prepilin-type N-terminal cleavage/methylation domain-containing protein